MGRFFIVSASYTRLAKIPQEIFTYSETNSCTQVIIFARLVRWGN